jgi:hypothetical protein
MSSKASNDEPEGTDFFFCQLTLSSNPFELDQRLS